jgi:predicted RNA-binding protein
MCQSSVYIRKNGKEELIFKDATLVEPCEEGTRIEGFFTKPATVRASIAAVDLLNHKIILEPGEQHR